MPPPGGGFSPQRGPGGMGTPGGGMAYGSPGRVPGSVKYVNEAMCGIGIFIGKGPLLIKMRGEANLSASRCLWRNTVASSSEMMMLSLSALSPLFFILASFLQPRPP